ncbi:hypothetical protein EXIGLDRAFT_767272 [Exidia glandulosa HHB12029]|uniref:F-box domain-containing protein n=1 Tax=Exidia glandulosa HHB12029 TaxID=1314781 RepID=A0A165J4G6_EXIGL|nr:hypothetical protein EXIGLDRAFT_767272 [Exidia glandulosa HHB12029]
MSLMTLPAELLLAIAEHLCWDLEYGWDSWRLLPLAQSCRYVSSSIAPLIGSSVGHYVSWSSPLARKMRETPLYYRIRSINVWLDFHVCAAPGSECAFTDTTCVAPIVALCQLNLVHLDFHLATDELLYNIASKVDALPRLRFLRVVSDSGSLSFGAVGAVTRHCPALETLCFRISLSRDGTLVPKQKVPFRLRCLRIEAGDLDAGAFAWLCSSSVGSLEHLKFEGGCSESLRDIAWIESDIAKAALAVLPRLTIRFHAKLCATHLIRFTSNLTHLTTNIDSVPSLDVLPSSLTSVHLDAWHRCHRLCVEVRIEQDIESRHFSGM